MPTAGRTDLRRKGGNVGAGIAEDAVHREAAAARPRRTPVPTDPALPRLPLLLDPEAMAPFLHRSLPPDAPAIEARVAHVRYAPGRKLLVHYDVGLDGRRHDAVAMIAAGEYLVGRALKPESVGLAERVRERSTVDAPLRFEAELGALVHWYPLDLDLPALAEPPAHLVVELEAAGLSIGAVAEPVVLGYRPRRRAVLRLGEGVLKLYAREANFDVARTNLLAAAGLGDVRTAEFEGALPARRITVQRLLEGSPPRSAEEVAREAGGLLRELAGAARALEADLREAPPSHQLAVAASSARYVAALLPPLRPRVEALVRVLEERAPALDRLVLAHGDFSARQLLVTDGGLAVVDLDAMRLAPAALDPATYAAHLVWGDPGDLDAAGETLERLLEGYGSRPDGLAWYVATSILRHARAPFRYFDERWPERVEGMVDAAARALDR